MATRPTPKATGPTSAPLDWELTLNLYRLFPIKVTFPDITQNETQQAFLQQVRDFQEDFLGRLYAFQEKFMNFHDDLREVPLKTKTANGFKTLTIRDLRKKHAHFVKLYYDTIDALIDLFPHLPPTRLHLKNHAFALLVRQFEREVNSVYVKPIQAITRGILCDIYCIWTPEDGAVYLPTYLNVNPQTLNKQDICKLKLQMVGRLERKAIFSDSFDVERIAKLVNAVQGQIEGHSTARLACYAAPSSPQRLAQRDQRQPAARRHGLHTPRLRRNPGPGSAHFHRGARLQRARLPQRRHARRHPPAL